MSQNTNNRGRLSITCEPQHSEAISHWIEQALNQTPVETQRPNTPIIQLDIYFETRLHADIALHALPAVLPSEAKSSERRAGSSVAIE